MLAPIFGIDDPRTSKDVDFVGGIRGAAELERRVTEEGWSLALHLFPTRIEQLIAVSDAGQAHAAEEHVVRAEAALGAVRACVLAVVFRSP